MTRGKVRVRGGGQCEVGRTRRVGDGEGGTDGEIGVEGGGDGDEVR